MRDCMGSKVIISFLLISIGTLSACRTSGSGSDLKSNDVSPSTPPNITIPVLNNCLFGYNVTTMRRMHRFAFGRIEIVTKGSSLATAYKPQIDKALQLALGISTADLESAWDKLPDHSVRISLIDDVITNKQFQSVIILTASEKRRGLIYNLGNSQDIATVMDDQFTACSLGRKEGVQDLPTATKVAQVLAEEATCMHHSANNVVCSAKASCTQNQTNFDCNVVGATDPAKPIKIVLNSDMQVASYKE